MHKQDNVTPLEAFQILTNEEMGLTFLTGLVDTSLKEIVLPDCVDIIWAEAFCDLTNLENVIFNIGLKKINERAFYGCHKLTHIEIPASVNWIDSSAFENCNGLENIQVDSNNKKYMAIDNCLIETETNTLIAGCKTSIIPPIVTKIASHAFAHCSGLNEIELPTSITEIDRLAFYDCIGIKNLKIPASTNKIEASAFNGCSGLENIFVDSSNQVYTAIGNCLIETATNTLIAGCKTSVIPSSITKIQEGAFCGCRNLINVIIPPTVTRIGNDAFALCNELADIKLPPSITKIEYRTFFGCHGLTHIEIPSSVTYIGICSFYNCVSLQDVTYLGSKEDWGKIEICPHNDYLLNANIEFKG